MGMRVLTPGEGGPDMPTCGEQDSVPSRAEVVAEQLPLSSIGYLLLPEPMPQLSVSKHQFPFGLCGRRRGWDVSREQHRNMYSI